MGARRSGHSETREFEHRIEAGRCNVFVANCLGNRISSSRGIKRKGFEHLLRRPFSRWMSVTLKCTTRRRSCVRTINEADLKPSGVYGEEVDGRELRMVVWRLGACTWQSKPARS